jgi:PAS domain-containing protein
MGTHTDSRPALKLVQPAVVPPVEFTWFCGHCAAPAQGDQPPAPMARVCRSCGLGVMLETRADIAPSHRDAFLVIDSSLLVQAMSWRAETLLGVTEDSAVNRPVMQLLVPADAEAGRPAGFAAALVEAAAGADEPVNAFIRPWNTFGVRLRARVASCGPPRAALVVLEDQQARSLRVVN